MQDILTSDLLGNTKCSFIQNGIHFLPVIFITDEEMERGFDAPISSCSEIPVTQGPFLSD